MSQQKQAPLPRQEFQEWLENAAVPVLVLQKGKHLGSVVKVPATPEIDYLFGCETFYGERISWSDRLEFCGLYDRQHQALHLLDDPLPNFVSGLTEEECQDSTAFGKRIAQEVDRYVEAAISNERSRLSVRELTSERKMGTALTTEQGVRFLESHILPHQNRGILKNRADEIAMQFQSVLAKNKCQGIRTQAEKKEVASAWLELAISCAKVPVKYEADEIKRRQKEEKTQRETEPVMA